MKKYTLDQYKQMAEKFNRMPFYKQIQTLLANKDILTLASDGNCWGVRVKDELIHEELSDSDSHFTIENEWGSSELFDLISLLGLENVDY